MCAAGGGGGGVPICIDSDEEGAPPSSFAGLDPVQCRGKSILCRLMVPDRRQPSSEYPAGSNGQRKRPMLISGVARASQHCTPSGGAAGKTDANTELEFVVRRKGETTDGITIRVPSVAVSHLVVRSQIVILKLQKPMSCRQLVMANTVPGEISELALVIQESQFPDAFQILQCWLPHAVVTGSPPLSAAVMAEGSGVP